MKTKYLAIVVISLLLVSSALPLFASAKPDEVKLTILELKANAKPDNTQYPTEDNGATNPDYALLRQHWFSTANYWVNPANSYGFTTQQVTDVVQASANAWDIQTDAAVFEYKGTTTLTAGVGDRVNVVDWGTYQSGVIAVTYIWSIGRQIIETDLRMNTQITSGGQVFGWSLTGESNKFDVQNILTHEFGHWTGLKDLYTNADYYLTMYGYGDLGQTWKSTLGLGDIAGLEAFYGP